jgi:hypothetical protein
MEVDESTVTMWHGRLTKTTTNKTKMKSKYYGGIMGKSKQLDIFATSSKLQCCPAWQKRRNHGWVRPELLLSISTCFPSLCLAGWVPDRDGKFHRFSLFLTASLIQCITFSFIF